MKDQPAPIVREYQFHELHDASKAAGCHHLGGHDWSGGMTSHAEVLHALKHGSQYMLAESEKLLSEIHTQLDMTGVLRETELSVVGVSPCVPAFLAGSPACMRRVVEHEDQQNGQPVRVYFGLVSSGAISADDLAKRAAAIMAFAQVLSMSRPVELVGVAAARPDQRDICIKIQLGLAPVDLSALCAVAHPGVQRGGLYGLICTHDGRPADYHTLRWPRTAEAILAGREPGDVFFKSPHSDELADLVRDPAAWVQAQLELTLRGTGGAYAGHST